MPTVDPGIPDLWELPGPGPGDTPLNGAWAERQYIGGLVSTRRLGTALLNDLKNEGLDAALELGLKKPCASFIQAVLSESGRGGDIIDLFGALGNAVIVLRGWRSNLQVESPDGTLVRLGDLLGEGEGMARAITHQGNLFLGASFLLSLRAERGQLLLHEAVHVLGLGDYEAAEAAARLLGLYDLRFESPNEASDWFQERLESVCK